MRKTECFTLLAGVVVSLFVVTPARAQNTPQKVEQKRAANVQTLYGLLPQRRVGRLPAARNRLKPSVCSHPA